MSDPAEFDAFYKDARDRLLLQTFALTGDLPAARRAVDDAFVAAWHHWRKVSRAADREAEVRSRAWSQAQRRATARVWHRGQDVDPDNAATLDALAKLPTGQRKVLLLTALSAGSLDGIAREAGMTRTAAEHALQHATARFSVHRQLPSTGVGSALHALGRELTGVRWPRGSILRRAGTARRRAHTALGAAVVVVALLVSGVVVGLGHGVRPALTAGDAHRPTRVATPEAAAAPAALSADDLLGVEDLGRWGRGRTWRAGRSTGNTDGDGLVLPCQRERYADPSPTSALVRTLTAEPAGSTGPKRRQAHARPRLSVRQLSELSASPGAASRALRSTVGWYAGCADPGTQLLGTYDLPGVGDRASLFVLRAWRRPARTLVVGTGRTGRITTTVVTSTSAARADRRGAVRLLRTALDRACHADGGGGCSLDGRVRARAPYAVGAVPALLSEVDLPGVGRVQRPWVGTVARKATANYAASGCARAPFVIDTMSSAMTRSFVIPAARLPATFGITQTAGAMPAHAARAWVSGVRARLGVCVGKKLGTRATLLTSRRSPTGELLVWRITTEVSEKQSVSYLMALIRRGTAVSQLGFIPAPGATMGPGRFTALAVRAQERLAAMPAPKRTAAHAHDHGHPTRKPGRRGRSKR